MNKRYQEISVKEADDFYVMGVPLQYCFESVWSNDDYSYKYNPESLPSRCGTSSGWRVEIDG